METFNYVDSPYQKIMETHYPLKQYGREINLGLAASPIGPDKGLLAALGQDHCSGALIRYNEDVYYGVTKTLMIDGLGLTGLKPESIELNGNGSYQMGDEIVRLAAGMGFEQMIVPNYSFPNSRQWAIRHDIGHRVVKAPDLDPITAQYYILTLDASQLHNSIVYIDYPNNPYGSADPDLLRAIIKHTQASGGLPLIDLAYGEVLGQEFNDAIQYTIEHNGIVLASLSKTQGLPNLRVGYAIIPPSITEQYYKGKQRMVFNSNPYADFALRYLFEKDVNGATVREHHAVKVAEYNLEANQKLYAALLDKGLRVLPTLLETPIQGVSGEKNFYEQLLRLGLYTESFCDYCDSLPPGEAGLGQSAVRMLTPGPTELDEVIQRINQL